MSPEVRRWITFVVAAGWPVALVAIVVATVGGDGFNPTDEGLLASAGMRVMDGQVPHRGFLSPRTGVSVYLHLPELLLPTPAFLTGRAVAAAQIVAYSVLLAWLIFDRPPPAWGAGRSAGALGSALVNLNTAPLMPWYTTDALLLASAGLLAVRTGTRRESVRWLVVAGALLALSAMAKQSFVPIVVFGLAWVIAASPPGHRLRRTVAAGAGALLPVASYAAAAAAADALDPMLRQMTAVQPVLLGEMLAPIGSPAAVILVVGLPVALVASGSRVVAGRRRGPILQAILACALVTVALAVVATSGLRYTGFWGILLTWLLASYVVASAVLPRRLDVVAAIVVVLAWSTALSYGVPVPNLVAGSVLLVLLQRTAPALPRWPAVPSLAPASFVFGVLLLVAVPAFVIARIEYVHRDAPRDQLTSNLGAMSPELRGIRTNDRTASYLSIMRDCAEAHPAGSVAVVPDNAGLYAAFGWRNPLPVDFLYPPEYAGNEEAILSATGALAERGDFLVLFQRVRADSLVDPAAVDLTGGRDLHAYDAALIDSMRELLSTAGRPVTCGPFDGRYSPGG